MNGKWLAACAIALGAVACVKPSIQEQAQGDVFTNADLHSWHAALAPYGSNPIATDAGEIRNVDGKLIARATPNGDSTTVDLTITNVPAGLQMGWAINLNSCVGQRAADGAAFTPFTTDAHGTGHLRTTIPVRLDQGQIYSAAVYLTPAEHTGAVACGTLYPPGQATS